MLRLPTPTAIIGKIRKLLRRLVPFGRRRPADTPADGEIAPGPVATVTYRMAVGGAGTGKTALIRAEAAAIASTPGRKLMVIASSQREAAATVAAIGSAGEHRCFVGSARALICSLLPDHLLSADEELLPLLLDHLTSAPAPDLPCYTDILVDDAQNLSPTFLRMLDRMAHPDGCRVVYFADPAQAIFGFTGAGSDTLALMRARSGSRVARLRLRHRPAPVVLPPLPASSGRDAVAIAAQAAARTLTDGGGSVALLTRSNAEAAEAAAILSSRSIACTLLSGRPVSASDPTPPPGRERWIHYSLREADLTATLPDGVTVATVHTFRDRTANHVIALDTAPASLRGSSAMAEERRRIATAIARATSTARIVRIIPSG